MCRPRQHGLRRSCGPLLNDLLVEPGADRDGDEACYFHKSYGGLAALVKNELRTEPFAGAVFVFRAKRADRLKLLYRDGTALLMTYKRLEETTFTWPTIRDGLKPLNHAQFEALFTGLDWRKAKALLARPPAAAE